MKTWKLLREKPKLFKRYFVKEYIIKAIREFFEELNFHELESPILTCTLPQERYLDVLSTTITFRKNKKYKAYLIPSTESFNKKMLVAGLGNHFVVTKVFRDLEEVSSHHIPEFTMLEWYTVGKNYFDLMTTTEKLIIFIKKFLDKKFGREQNLNLIYQGQKINLKSPWYRFSVSELFEKFLKRELRSVLNINAFKELGKNLDLNIDKNDDWQSIFERIFAIHIEPNLPKEKPVFVYDYPKILCPLTKEKKTDPDFCEKVELYFLGKEIGNGYTELTDPKEQKRRFLEEKEARKKLRKEEIKFDHDLIEALKLGIPEVAGIGIGIDRLAMIFANTKNISDVNYFPLTEEI